MSIHPDGPSRYAPEGRPANSPLLCNRCGTDSNVTLHSITAISPHSEFLVEVGYTCTVCKLHSVERADVAAVAAVLNRVQSTNGILVFGGHYIHCGRPMQKLGSEVRRLTAPSFTDGLPDDALDVYLTARVLRCSCGFQIELPE